MIVIGVLHDLNLAARFTARLVLLQDGKTPADSNAADVLSIQNLHTAFGVHPVRITNPATGNTIVALK